MIFLYFYDKMYIYCRLFIRFMIKNKYIVELFYNYIVIFYFINQHKLYIYLKYLKIKAYIK